MVVLFLGKRSFEDLYFANVSMLGKLINWLGNNKRLLTTSVQPHSKDPEKWPLVLILYFFSYFLVFQQLNVIQLHLCYTRCHLLVPYCYSLFTGAFLLTLLLPSQLSDDTFHNPWLAEFAHLCSGSAELILAFPLGIQIINIEVLLLSWSSVTWLWFLALKFYRHDVRKLHPLACLVPINGPSKLWDLSRLL